MRNSFRTKLLEKERRYLLVPLLLFVLIYIWQTSANMATAPEWYRKLEIIPDVIPEVAPNLIPLKVVFPKGEVKEGNILAPVDVKNEPQVSWEAEENALYTLVKSDPDAPSRKDPRYREWRHWVVTNIPGNKISEGTVNSAYIGAGPPKGSGLHRYVFLLFKQNGPINVEKLSDTGMTRASFLVREFAANNNLGLPIGIAAYQAQNE